MLFQLDLSPCPAQNNRCMLRARVFLSVFALLAWASLGCLNPVTADAGAMDCCAGLDCSAGDAEHDCCQTMSAAPQAALATNATPAAQAPAAVFSGVSAQEIASVSAGTFFEQSAVPRSHAPPLYTLYAAFLI